MILDLTDKDFAAFSNLIYEKCGINLHRGKKELLKARLAKILRQYHFDSIPDYYKFLVNDATGNELVPLLDHISTNLTYFFREPNHFDFLGKVALPCLERNMRSRSRKRLQVWCAGCSSGEEAYSLAITLMEHLGAPELWEIHVVGSDISTRMLDTARKGIYSEDKVNKVPYELRKRYFQRGIHKWEGFYRVKPSLQKLVEFTRVNLIEPFPFDHPFDIIFCRNVMIYFDKPTQEILVNKFFQRLSAQGYFVIGHSESLTGITHGFRYVQPSVYCK